MRALRFLPLVTSLVLYAAAPAMAQIKPFDMSPERPPEVQAPPPVTPQAPQVSDDESDLPAAAPAPTDQRLRKYIIPAPEMQLLGEYARKSWFIYLTEREAQAGTELHLSYQNAIIVAPEVSHLTILANGSEVAHIPVESPDRPSNRSFKVPPNLLRAGQNEITVQVSQRHRTDCTISSTHELWANILPEGTYLSFDMAGQSAWEHVEDVKAIGVDQLGGTTFTLVVPAAFQPPALEPIIRLSQGLALTANMPDQFFDISQDAVPQAGPGKLSVLLGTASELKAIVDTLPDTAETSPTIDLMSDGKGGQALVVTGPSWDDVGAAINGLTSQVDRPPMMQRLTLSTQSWRVPDVPLLVGETNLKFSELGIDTLEFTGRRLRTDFAIGVPSDFYAGAYGEATILLDAAYSPEVLPGSHIDVYVNDNIAATVPINTSGGEILRHLPIKVTMRHFRPGSNTISIEAILLTTADAVCAPGATALDRKRFVLFDTSEFVMPAFARIGQIPNLAALGGTGFPYNRALYSLPLLIDRTQKESLSAAATFMARISATAGRMVPVDTSVSAASVADRNAVFIGAMPQIPPSVLAATGVGSESQTAWGSTPTASGASTDTTFDEWRERLRGRGWRGRVSVFEDWLNRTFNVSTESFRLFAAATPLFVPNGRNSLLVAQSQSPVGPGVWTLVAAPDHATLRDNVKTLAQRTNWAQMGGRITTLDGADGRMTTIPVARMSFFETQPFSVSNYRYIAANWLSANSLSYSLALIAMSIVLGFATAYLLGSLGRGQ